MFDTKQAYIQAYTARAEELRQTKPNAAIIQAYDSLLNVISADYRFRAQGYIELSQPREREDD